MKNKLLTLGALTILGAESTRDLTTTQHLRDLTFIIKDSYQVSRAKNYSRPSSLLRASVDIFAYDVMVTSLRGARRTLDLVYALTEPEKVYVKPGHYQIKSKKD